MRMDDVKPPGGNPGIRDCLPDTPAEPKASGGFAAKDKLQSFGAAEPQRPTLAVASQFTRTALEDPAKLNDMVRASVSELIDSGDTITGSLSAAQKGSLVDFLSEDPLLRRQIETYLRKVVT